MPTKVRELPPQDILLAIFEYSPDTGTLIRRSDGSEAGCVFVSKSGTWKRVKIHQVAFMAHRVIWKMVTGHDPIEIDHKDRDGLNNRWDNLRSVTHMQNAFNQSQVWGKTVPKGVSPHQRKWMARIRHKGKAIYLGLYLTPEEAHNAYIAAARELHGEFSNVRGYSPRYRQERTTASQ